MTDSPDDLEFATMMRAMGMDPPPGDAGTPSTRQFERWVRDHDGLSAAERHDVLTMFAEIQRVAECNGLSLDEPDDVARLLHRFGPADGHPAETLPPAIRTLDGYIHFQLEISSRPEEWEPAHRVAIAIAERFELTFAFVPPSVIEAMRRGLSVDRRLREDAVDETPLVPATDSLLDWLGSGRPVTPRGLPRRADIAWIAGVIGVDAVGGARARRHPTDGGPRIARSLIDLPIPLAWWQALFMTDVIALTASHVVPGPNADAWRRNATPPLELREHLVAAFTATVADPIRQGESARNVFRFTLDRLTDALDGFDLTEPRPPGARAAVERRAHRRIRDLSRMRILALDERGAASVPEGLVFSVGFAVAQLNRLGSVNDRA